MILLLKKLNKDVILSFLDYLENNKSNSINLYVYLLVQLNHSISTL